MGDTRGRREQDLGRNPHRPTVLARGNPEAESSLPFLLNVAGWRGPRLPLKPISGENLHAEEDFDAVRVRTGGRNGCPGAECAGTIRWPLHDHSRRGWLYLQQQPGNNTCAVVELWSDHA